MDDSEDIRKVADILEEGGVTFRQACRNVYETHARNENFDNFCARLYTKREKEILPLLSSYEADDPEEVTEEEVVPLPPAFRP
jgi:hypothetical protein